MITKDNLKALLLSLSFEKNGNQYSKQFANPDAHLKVDFDKNLLVYPEDQGLKIYERQTCNFSANENFVVFECVHLLLDKGYKPELMGILKNFILLPLWSKENETQTF